MNNKPLLTIAIPTFNRAKYLRELLSSLFAQLTVHDNVELLISDNASPDETPDVMRDFESRGMRFRYIRNRMNIGSDANFLQCYEQAAGKYFWLFGDDDLLLDGGMGTITRLLDQQELDFVCVAPSVFEETPAEILQKKRIVPTRIVNDRFELAALTNLHSDLIYISSGIINKERISSLQHPEFSSLIGTNLVQLGWILTSLRYFRRGLFVQLGVLAARVGNSPGGLGGAEIFGKNYRHIVSSMLGNDSELAAKLLNEHMRIWFPRNWQHFRAEGLDLEKRQEFLTASFKTNPWYWIAAYPIVRAPESVSRIWSKAFRFVARIRTERRSVERKGTPVNTRSYSFPDSITRGDEGSDTDQPRVAAVVVVYYPDRAFERLLNSVACQVATVFVIDNTPADDANPSAVPPEYQSSVRYIQLGENTGIAFAQNAGIERAAKERHTHVLLLDDDSALPPDAVHNLLEAERVLKRSGVQVGALGPAFIDELNGKLSSGVRHRWFREERIPINPSSREPIETDYLIASGSLIRVNVLKDVGPMRDQFFLNWVDAEWCFRARDRGYRCYIVPSVLMAHSIGDAVAHLFGKEFRLHSLFNEYYYVRNGAFLLRVRTMGWKYRSMMLVTLPKFILVHGWLNENRLRSFKVLLRALREGLFGTMRDCTKL